MKIVRSLSVSPSVSEGEAILLPRSPAASRTLLQTPTPKSTLVDTISALWTTKKFADIHFFVGPTQAKILAHKTILMMRSLVFEEILTKRLENSKEITIKVDGNDGIVEISLPRWNPEAFEIFLEFLYTDKLSLSDSDKPFNMVHAVEVLTLSDVYKVPLLFSTCSSFIDSNILLENCIPIYQRLVTVFPISDITKHAFEMLIHSLDEVCSDYTLLTSIQESTWMELLHERVRIKELKLFKALKWWSQQNTDNEEQSRLQLMKFVPFLKFETMKAIEFTEEIVPTRILSESKTIEWFVYFVKMQRYRSDDDDDDNDDDNNNERYPPLVPSRNNDCKMQNQKLAINADVLQTMVEMAAPGDTIRLEDANYIGNFTLLQDDVTIIGSNIGSSAVSNLIIGGKNCRIINVKLPVPLEERIEQENGEDEEQSTEMEDEEENEEEIEEEEDAEIDEEDW